MSRRRRNETQNFGENEIIRIIGGGLVEGGEPLAVRTSQQQPRLVTDTQRQQRAVPFSIQILSFNTDDDDDDG